MTAADWLQLVAAVEALGLRVLEVDKKMGMIVAAVPAVASNRKK
jgi:hypothetical protein